MRIELLCLLMIMGCGPASGGTEGSGGGTSGSEGSGSSGESTAAAETSTASVTSAETSSGSSATSTGAPACDVYASTPDIGPAVAVTIRHDGTSPVFFDPHGCGGAFTVTVTNADGQDVPWVLDTECFPNTCEGFVASTDCTVGCDPCAGPSTGRIEPAAVTDAQWPGRALTELELEPECAPVSECPSTCVRAEQAPAGVYEVALTVYRTCTGDCECEATEDGTCFPGAGTEQLADPVTFAATLDYPTQTTVEIAITD